MTPREEFEQEWKRLCSPKSVNGLLHRSPFNDSNIAAVSLCQCDRNLGQYFSAHGIAKGLLSQQKDALFALLENGVSEKTYYAPFVFTEADAPLMGAATGTAGGAYKDGFAVVLSDYKKELKDGIRLVLITDLGESLLPSLRKMYPNIIFEKLSQAQKAFETLYKEATGKQWVSENTRTNSTNTEYPSIDELIMKPFEDEKGHHGTRYLDKQGNIIITQTHFPSCTKRVYANGLTMHMWDNPKSTTYTDGSKKGKEAQEILVTEPGHGCTKDVSTTGELKRKIEEVRKAGLLVTTLPEVSTNSPLQSCLKQHSMENVISGTHKGKSFS